jgi:hypothetical protein
MDERRVQNFKPTHFKKKRLQTKPEQGTQKEIQDHLLD